MDGNSVKMLYEQIIISMKGVSFSNNHSSHTVPARPGLSELMYCMYCFVYNSDRQNVVYFVVCVCFSFSLVKCVSSTIVTLKLIFCCFLSFFFYLLIF